MKILKRMQPEPYCNEKFYNEITRLTYTNYWIIAWMTTSITLIALGSYSMEMNIIYDEWIILLVMIFWVACLLNSMAYCKKKHDKIFYKYYKRRNE